MWTVANKWFEKCAETRMNFGKRNDIQILLDPKIYAKKFKYVFCNNHDSYTKVHSHNQIN